MLWIESHVTLGRHPKLRNLARELRLRPAYATGHLHLLWHAALEVSEDGDLSSWPDELIAEAADYPGDAPQFVRLLQKHRWLEDNKLLHDWLDYAGKYLISKYSSKKRERLVVIWEKHGRVYGDKKATDGRPVGDHQLVAPDPTPPNLTKPPDLSLSPAPARAPEPDPNAWPEARKPVEKHVVQPPTHARILKIHDWYCTMTDQQPLGPTLERQWFEFLRLFTEDDFKRVFAYLRGQIRIDKRNPGALKLSNLLQPDKFGEDLALARTNINKPIPAKAEPKPTTELPPEILEARGKKLSALLHQALDQPPQ